MMSWPVTWPGLRTTQDYRLLSSIGVHLCLYVREGAPTLLASETYITQVMQAYIFVLE